MIAVCVSQLLPETNLGCNRGQVDLKSSVSLAKNKVPIPVIMMLLKSSLCTHQDTSTWL